jgi:hypothetical protein
MGSGGAMKIVAHIVHDVADVLDVVYCAGCAVGRIWHDDKPSGASEIDKPPYTP